MATGRQLDQLCFANLAGRSQAVVRGRVIHRLIRWRVLRSLDRFIGGANGGSTELIVGLDSIGAILAQQRAFAAGRSSRQVGLPGERFVRHTLAVTQVLTDLCAHAAGTSLRVETFEIEPLSWWPDGLGGQLKPDAYVALIGDQLRNHWWIEVDRATESLPTLSRKLRRYVDFARRGQFGPGRVVPRVLVSVISDRRLEAVQRLAAGLPDPAPEQLVIVRDRDAAHALLGGLRE
ncbi:MAG: replication-relaxation family protein [Frankiaceae bacterium]|nr:replication-relaxation family protein [Frankiaceae bacterium]MBV9870768.1 replication-relaxation family protein [Frankiaceae bacterium]